MIQRIHAPLIQRATEAAIDEAARHLLAGQLVAFPTETVYGLGANAASGEAVARIYEAKGRPRFNPLIVHVASIEAAQSFGEFNAIALDLARAFWPGPLTLVVPLKPGSAISSLATAGLETVAVRMPDHPVARRLLTAVGIPLAAPSANRSGHVSATRAEHVADDLDHKIAMVLDGGPTAHGLESTIIDTVSGRAHLLRPGALPVDAIEAVTGKKVERAALDENKPTSSGQLASHYAPRAKLRLNAVDVMPGEALLAFGSDVMLAEGPVINLSPRGDLIEAAANLFQALRSLDAMNVAAIAAMPIPDEGLGEAINDRLRRAAAPR